MKKIAVVPAYEPEELMLPLLKELKKNDYFTIVINDGSNEKFDSIFEQAKEFATVLKHDVNKGKGAALKTAFLYIKDKFKNYLIVTLDCDAQHKVSDANRLLEYLEKNPTELVIGKRVRSGKTPLRSRIGNSLTRLVFYLAAGIDVYDTQTGLRAFTDKLMDFMLNLSGDRYEYEMNMLLECPRNKIVVKEIEIETIYFNNNANSHFNSIKDSLKIYKQIFKFSSNSLFCYIADYILYVIFILTLENIYISNIFAKVISFFASYSLNKKSPYIGKNKPLIMKYCLSLLIIILLNITILGLLVNYLSINKFLAKILTELILLFVIFIIKKIFALKNKKII